MRWVWPYLVLAGCSDQGALEIVVTSRPELPTKKVELYVGYSAHRSENIRPANGTLDPTVWWKRDAQPELDVLRLSGDGEAVFAFQPDGNYNGVAALVAVGLGVDEADGDYPTGVAARLAWTDIPGDEIHRYTLDLGPFTTLPMVSPDVPALRLWGPAAEPRKCVQVANVPELMMDEYRNESGTAPKSGMIVAGDDPDCDDLRKSDDPATNRECFEYEYMAQAAMQRDSLRCALQQPLPNGGSMCVAGGSTCADGTGSDPSVCSPSSYCLPQSMCCPSGDCPLHRDLMGEVAEYECALTTGFDANSPYLCDQSVAILDLRMFSGLGLTCDRTLGAKLRRDHNTSWQADLTIPGTTTHFHVAPTPTDCVFELSGSGPRPTFGGGSPIAEFRLMISVPLTDPVSGRGVMFPVTLKLGATSTSPCPQQRVTTMCVPQNFSSTDVGLGACIRAPVPPGQAVKD